MNTRRAPSRPSPFLLVFLCVSVSLWHIVLYSVLRKDQSEEECLPHHRKTRLSSLGSRPVLRGICTWVGRGLRCSTGCWRGITIERGSFCCGSRIPIWLGQPRRPARSFWRI